MIVGQTRTVSMVSLSTIQRTTASSLPLPGVPSTISPRLTEAVKWPLRLLPLTLIVVFKTSAFDPERSTGSSGVVSQPIIRVAIGLTSHSVKR
ncbi:hypothetical protein TNCV_1715061 [Trichonephila clavipes]|nr:hypothetical protein TNCV_1715061 [Trichonephila clavipes]